MLYTVMATLLHFLRSVTVALLTGFLSALMALGLLLGGLMIIDVSPVSPVSAPVYALVSQFLRAFGGGDLLEGIVAISLTVGVVFTLLVGFGSYKRRQRYQWHLTTFSLVED